MDEIQAAYSRFVRGEIQANANPYPTGVQGFRAGVEYERERIIALLEADDAVNIFWSEPNSYICGQYLDEIIALIKGEAE